MIPHVRAFMYICIAADNIKYLYAYVLAGYVNISEMRNFSMKS